MNEIVPTRTLAKQGVAAIGGIAGGLGLLALSFLSRFPVISLIAGGVVTIIGIGALSSPESDDRRGGLLATVAGGLTILSKVPFFAGFAGGLMSLAIVALLGSGIWNAVKFFKGLKSRS